MVSKKTASRIMLGVTIAVAIGSLTLIVFLLRDLEWEVFRRSNLFYLGGILLLSALGTFLYTLEIFVQLNASGFKCSIFQTYLVLTASMSANYVTPVKVGIPLRVYLYHHFMGISAGVGTGLMAIESLLGMMLPAFLAIWGIVALFPSISVLVPVSLLAVLLGTLLIILLIQPEFIERITSNRKPSGFVEKLIRLIAGIQIGLRRASISALLGMALLLVLNFIVTSVRLHLILYMLGHRVNLMHIFFVRTISVTVGSASLIPMGLGVRDASVTLLLSELGVPSKVALSAAAIERLFSPGWPLLLGLISANVLGVSELMRASHEATTSAGSKDGRY